MKLSARTQSIAESATLAMSAKVGELVRSGREIDNLTEGQLPFRTAPGFVELIKAGSDFLAGYRYAPVQGFAELCDKVLDRMEKSRSVAFRKAGFECVVTNGAKQAVFSALYALVEESDEVLLLSPYWVSYPEMIKLCGAIPKVVGADFVGGPMASLEDVAQAMTGKTKVVILNSPNNPAGIHYDRRWMDGFAELLSKHPDVWVISDEIYFDLCFFDPAPSYFYQGRTELLERTIVVEGISKSLAATGLRIGYCLAPAIAAKTVAKIQGQMTSGANSLVQRALIEFDFDLIDGYLEAVKTHLRNNARTLRELLEEAGHSRRWYQPMSAFYFLFDFSRSALCPGYGKHGGNRSPEVVGKLLDDHAVAVVDGDAFGMPNSARISLSTDKEVFRRGCRKIVEALGPPMAPLV